MEPDPSRGGWCCSTRHNKRSRYFSWKRNFCMFKHSSRLGNADLSKRILAQVGVVEALKGPLAPQLPGPTVTLMSESHSMEQVRLRSRRSECTLYFWRKPRNLKSQGGEVAGSSVRKTEQRWTALKSRPPQFLNNDFLPSRYSTSTSLSWSTDHIRREESLQSSLSRLQLSKFVLSNFLPLICWGNFHDPDSNIPAGGNDGHGEEREHNHWYRGWWKLWSGWGGIKYDQNAVLVIA